jgi:hypothetical protein
MREGRLNRAFMLQDRKEFLNDLSDSQLLDNDFALDNTLISSSEFVCVL